MSKYDLEKKSVENVVLSTLDEPISLIETFHPDVYLVQDNKKKLYVCTAGGKVVSEGLETRIKQECGIKNIVSLCAHRTERRVYVAGVTTTNSASPIYELGLDWLTDYQLDAILTEFTDSSAYVASSNFVSQAFSYPIGTQKALSSSLTSLTSITSTATTLTTNSSGPVTGSSGGAKPNIVNGSGAGTGGSHHPGGSYTALWHDTRTGKLLAAKSDKHRTVIEIFNSRTHFYEYSLVEGGGGGSGGGGAGHNFCERPLKKVTSICTTNDGKLVCVDLVQNFVKFFRFV